MGLLDGNYQDERLNKKVKPAIQGGGYNYLGKQETVTVPKRWLSDPDHVVAELAYITPKEAKVLLDLNLYGSLDGKPNNAPGGLPSLQGDMGSVGGGGSTGGGDGGDTREQYGAVGQYSAPPSSPTSNEDNNRPNPHVGMKNPELDLSHYGDPDPEVDVPTIDRKDTITDPINNIVADFKSNPYGYMGVLGITINSINQLNKTNEARAMMGLDPIGGLADGSADNGDQGQGEADRQLINNVVSKLPYAMTGTTPQDSMVNQYFANQPTSSLSSGLETSYNNAKSNINNILGIATPSQQFGYSAQPYGLLSSTNMATNPYKDYLTTRGLI